MGIMVVSFLWVMHDFSSNVVYTQGWGLEMQGLRSAWMFQVL